MKDFVISEVQNETAVLVGLITQTQDDRKTKEYLDELAFLAETAGAEIVKQFTQKLDTANSVTYVGKGKLQEIKEYLRSEKEEEREIGMVIFDDELSAKQLRNIEAELQVKILDRTSLILDIFAMRAQTANAKTQVELAQYKYMLPRLQRLWTHLERQGGGSGSAGSVGLRGPGETQLEMDKRIILGRMALLKERLVDIDRQKATQRKNRGKMIRVALVGYTNVGKSTIMNMLAKSEVFAENKLFATLDTTVRKVIIENLPFLLTDTVGFIRKLPTDLVESFKSTLDEVREADLLLHVVDISHPGFEEQIEIVNKTLADIDGGGKPMMLIFNKIDAYTYVEKAEDDLTPRTKENVTLEELMKTWMAKMEDNCLFISARERINIEELKSAVYEKVKQLHVTKYPYNDFLYQTYDEEEE
ncbi:GTPase HflX [Bacteroides sp.]|uniref:GTPase HflX n=1 Tax=Bacteroides sp. TaxID=29523 RepID=UPI001B6CE86F|nr:GTPase HflX [Bacteroides sp.]MBP6065916.1 GTPase HflX [Bacteroides sp.]MBP6068143.1 GTPase HflX [Bacteroides sp.]MBP6937550.1 GTPase HflX [Bacteroides sp.]MBP8622954.1 GTPase HflX [Bacteroides sp.]MBP9507313.1 GTPase HflX [Bacteroides sp.]